MTGAQLGELVGFGLLGWWIWVVGGGMLSEHAIRRERRERIEAKRGGESYVIVEVDTVEITQNGCVCRGMSRGPRGTIRVQFEGGKAEVEAANRAESNGRPTFFIEVPESKTTLIDGEVTGPSG